MPNLNTLNETRVFGGRQIRFTHPSSACDASMTASVYLPPGVSQPPALLWLSGLTCTDENMLQKAGAQRVAAELGLALIAPDTSPRGLNLPGEDTAWDFGSGAGFYVNATEAPWSASLPHVRLCD